YGAATYSSGHVLLMQDIEPSVDLRGRTVLLIDDILDSGLTTRFLLNHLAQRGAKCVRLCVLLHRKARERQSPDWQRSKDCAEPIRNSSGKRRCSPDGRTNARQSPSGAANQEIGVPGARP